MERPALVAVVVVAFLAVAAAGQWQPDSFELGNRCGRLTMLVTVDGGEALGITHERVGALVEGRLRVAQLFDGDSWPGPALLAGVGVAGSAVALGVEFVRPVLVLRTEVEGFASTWSRRAVMDLSEHGRDGDYVMRQLSELVDRFILEYLRANDEDCRGRNP